MAQFESDLVIIDGERTAPTPVWDSAPYWVWQMFDNQVPCPSYYGCTSKIPALPGTHL